MEGVQQHKTIDFTPMDNHITGRSAIAKAYLFYPNGQPYNCNINLK